MPDDKDLLENMDEDSMGESDFLEGFAEIDDLSALEGIEEFQDPADGEDIGDMDIPLPDNMETEEIPLPEAEVDGIADAFSEVSEIASDETVSGGAEEIPMPEAEDAAEKTEDTAVEALDDTAEEIPMPEAEDAAEETEDTAVEALDDTAEETPMPEAEDAAVEALDDTAEEMPMPEPEDAVIDALDDTAEEMPMPEPEDAVIDALDDTAEEMPMPEAEDAAVEALDDTAEEMPMPEPEDAVIDALDDTAEEIPMPEMEDAAAEAPMPESSEDGTDDMLDGLLDDLGITDMDLEEEENADPVSIDDSEMPEEEPEDNTDLFDLLNNSEDSVAEEDLEDVLNIGLPEAGKGEEEKAPGLLKRLFGNVVNDEIAEAERQAAEQEQVEAAEKAEQDAKRKEEKEAEKAEKAEQKAAAKAAKAEQKAAKKAEKEAAKAEKKARKEEEAAKEEQFEVTGKLNKVGVAIIAVLTVLFLTIEILGTNLYGANHTKRTANSYFKLGKYTQAYQEILGTNLQKKDPDTYNKIKTVMQVQRSIDSYNYYNDMNYYPEALNALLRGIERYDSNLEKARELDVVSDMDHCKSQIISLLNTEFGVSESEAYTLLSLEEEQYTTSVVQRAIDR